jgi:hypothetical protein
VSITFAPVRRAVAFGLLTLGLLIVAASSSVGQTTTPPPTATTKPLSSSTSSSSSTLPKLATAGGSGDRLPTLGEGFPWITVGAVILVAGLIGYRLRRAARR